MSRRRPLLILATASVALAACGSSSAPTVPAAEPAPAPTAAPEPAAEPATEPAAEPSIATAEAAPEEPATESTEAPATEPTEATAEEPAADEPADEPVEEPAPEPVGVVDGCSTDGSPTLVESAAGPAPAVEVLPASVDSVLIDLPVRRINCAGGWANLRNESPSDRPLLIWFWAPH